MSGIFSPPPPGTRIAFYFSFLGNLEIVHDNSFSKPFRSLSKPVKDFLYKTTDKKLKDNNTNDFDENFSKFVDKMLKYTEYSLAQAQRMLNLDTAARTVR